MGWKTPEESDERKSGESKSVLEVLGVITGSYKCGPHFWSDLGFSHLVVKCLIMVYQIFCKMCSAEWVNTFIHCLIICMV